MLIHPPGTLAHGALELLVHGIRIQAGDATQSFIGGAPQWLQNEDLALDGLAFALQIYGGELPASLRNLVFLADGVGYLFLPQGAAEGIDRSGLFFVQMT